MRARTLVVAVIALFTLVQGARAEITLGSKKFTESVILGEMLRLIAVDRGESVVHRKELGGTRVLFDALKAGEIDAYVEYSGTLLFEILQTHGLSTLADARALLHGQGIGISQPLGFNNTYGLGVAEPRAAALNVASISDLRAHPNLVFGFGNEFLHRADGWPALRSAYRLPQTNVTGLDHDLAYEALAAGRIDAMDVYTTDAKIVRMGIRVLHDDQNLFPPYEALVLYRLALARGDAPPAWIAALEGIIDEPAMRAMNAAVALEGQSDTAVAAAFLKDRLGIDGAVSAPSLWRDLWKNTLAHLSLVGISLLAAIAIAIPLGVSAYRRPRLGQGILAFTGLLQTIPSLALFVFMIPLLGIGGPPAIAALFLYSLLPIVRNTHAGLNDISLPVRESATALGLPQAVILRRIELPLAARAILSGIKTAAVINVGTATLGALIGAGGYGQPILTGIRLADTGLILQGAVPAAVLALLTQGVFELVERAVVPKGLRLRGGTGDA